MLVDPSLAAAPALNRSLQPGLVVGDAGLLAFAGVSLCAQRMCCGWVGFYSARTVDARQRHVAIRLVDVGASVLASAVLQQPHAFPCEHRGAKAVCLGDAPAQGVVLVAEDLALGLAVFACTHHRHLGQLVLVVVAVVLFGVAADAPSNQAAEIRLIDTFTGTVTANLLTLIAEHPFVDIFR